MRALGDGRKRWTDAGRERRARWGTGATGGTRKEGAGAGLYEAAGDVDGEADEDQEDAQLV